MSHKTEGVKDLRLHRPGIEIDRHQPRSQARVSSLSSPQSTSPGGQGPPTAQARQPAGDTRRSNQNPAPAPESATAAGADSGSSLMDMMGAMMGAGGQGSKYKPKTEESIPDKYEAMLAKDDIAPAHRATLEKMALRRKQRETKQEEDRAAALEASLTPAHRAAMASDAAALKQLDHSLLSARSTVGQTAAHLAAQAGAVECLEVVRALGPAGEALLAEPDDAGDTPAHLAAAAGSADALRFLHTCEAFPPAGPRTHSVLHAAVKGNSPVAVAALGKLLPAAATQVVDADDNTPAHLAAKLGHHECLKSVVGIGGPACVAVRHANGAAPPHDAAFYGHAACISVLLAALPSCAGWCDDDGDTPLHAAAARGHEEVLAELLAAAAGCAEDNALCGAASRNNTKNESPMTLAGMAGHTGCVEQLEQHAARIDGAAAPLHVVAEHMKAEGNLLTKIGDFSRAASSYERAIALYSPPADLPPSADASQTEGASQPPTLANADMASVLDDRPAVEVLLSLCTNLAVARSKTGEYKAAVQAAEDALLLQPANVKALCRKGIALAAMKDYAGAKEVFNAALVAEPDNEDVKKQLRQSLARQKREKAEEKKMAQKMFG